MANQKPTECKRWEEFLDEVIGDPVMIEHLQDFFGYCLYDKNEFNRSLMLTGPSCSGKSVICQVLALVVGNELVSHYPLADMNHPSVLAGLSRKKVNISYELPGPDWNSSTFKAMVGGDSLSGAFRYRDPFMFQPACKMVVELNHDPPAINNGFYRRFLRVTTVKTFMGEERGRNLFTTLSSELAGIVGWSLDGHKRLLARGGFDRPVKLPNGEA